MERRGFCRVLIDIFVMPFDRNFSHCFVYSFYKGIVPLWGRQIPYTMMKFACFERTVEALYRYVVPKKRDDCSKPEQLVVTFAAGYIGKYNNSLSICLSVCLPSVYLFL